MKEKRSRCQGVFCDFPWTFNILCLLMLVEGIMKCHTHVPDVHFSFSLLQQWNVIEMEKMNLSFLIQRSQRKEKKGV